MMNLCTERSYVPLLQCQGQNREGRRSADWIDCKGPWRMLWTWMTVMMRTWPSTGKSLIVTVHILGHQSIIETKLSTLTTPELCQHRCQRDWVSSILIARAGSSTRKTGHNRKRWPVRETQTVGVRSWWVWQRVGQAQAHVLHCLTLTSMKRQGTRTTNTRLKGEWLIHY